MQANNSSLMAFYMFEQLLRFSSWRVLRSLDRVSSQG